jgi:hypothetical protein
MWLYKFIKKANQEWWREALYHFVNIVTIQLPTTTQTYNLDNEPQLYIGKKGFKNGFRSNFGQYEYYIKFILLCKGHQYECNIILEFDRLIAPHLTVGFLKDLQAEFTGCKFYVLKDFGRGSGSVLGVTNFIPQESTPYNIFNHLIDIIKNDKDDNDDDNDDDGVKVNPPSNLVTI